MWINHSNRDTEWDWISIDKVRVKKVKIDKKLLPNEVDDDEVTYMINNFDEEVWHAVMINEDYFLLDGQHRLRLAFRTGIKYIDVIMEKRKDPKVRRRMKEEIMKRKRFERKMARMEKKIFGFSIPMNA